MWPIKHRNFDILALNITATGIHAGHLRLIQSSNPVIELLHYQFCALNAYDTHQGIIYNGTPFEQILRQSLLRNVKRIAIALTAPCIKEEILWSSTATPTRSDLFFADRERSVWQSHYLYPVESGGFHFYISALYPWIIHQYQTVALMCEKELVRVESTFSAVLSSYRALYGNTFRAAQLRHDMQRTDNALAQVFSRDSIHRLLRIKTAIDVAQNQETIMAFLGLSLSERSLS